MPSVDTSGQQPAASTAKKLIQAAALASMLVPLGAVAADAATINCTVESNCSGTGFYSSGVSGSNIWKFYTDASFDTLLYSLMIEGVAGSNFEVDVADRQVSVFNLEEFNIPGAGCIPFLDESETDNDTCVIFDVTATPAATWIGDYYIEMRWFAPPGEPGSSPLKPPDDGRNHIYRSDDGFNFIEQLGESEYDPELEADPEDPALGGRGDSFSSFIAGRESVPEPATLLLLGTGVAATLYRRRRRNQ